ncbi:MAG: glycosyltransferase [Methanobacteriota archaeon]|nr:MAG: glycosyltransferase [Euryarchaeota archaeon]
MSSEASAEEPYILATPMKNESEMIDGLVDTVLSQTIRPSLWVVVDDSSSDDSYDKMERVARDHDWVALVSKKASSLDVWLRYGEAVDHGVRKGSEYASKKGVQFTRIGVLDADTVLEPQYFERLAEAMSANRGAAIATGLIVSEQDPHLKGAALPRGCARLYDRRFLQEVGGFPITPSPDTVLEIKAQNRGYEVVIDPRPRGVHKRATDYRKDYNGMKLTGKCHYCLGTGLMTAMALAAARIPHWGLMNSFAFLFGYVEGMSAKHERVNDREVQEYFSSQLKNRLLGVI